MKWYDDTFYRFFQTLWLRWWWQAKEAKYFHKSGLTWVALSPEANKYRCLHGILTLLGFIVLEPKTDDDRCVWSGYLKRHVQTSPFCHNWQKWRSGKNPRLTWLKVLTGGDLWVNFYPNKPKSEMSLLYLEAVFFLKKSLTTCFKFGLTLRSRYSRSRPPFHSKLVKTWLYWGLSDSVLRNMSFEIVFLCSPMPTITHLY